ncbi:ATP F0F1 synthase subunit B [Phenylobacterium sp.]|uniref:F0F1 ATP synthase subunit B family protein n=1 Tax=Phenylobacterium sp. TaxID=1871053 RepID=UPI00273340D5|nr:ATP F0F1 synthase subunit B [Phenylobacterium sp.]MDP3173522.1 ATP F0F1 synthase subunit B [Phenylobacterium sp.]MDP3658773.1 ATP F0F1 synthase subunit B [Phenylobacterium sp.]
MIQELLTDSHFWVGVAFVIFLGVLARAGVHKLAWNALGESGRKVQAQLDEAAALRTEAQALLDQIKTQREEAGRQAEATLIAAKEEAERLKAEAQVKLAEQIQRRGQLAERRIATAEAQAQADVKAAAAELAAEIAETVLTRRLAEAKTDPLVDSALGQLGGRAFPSH